MLRPAATGLVSSPTLKSAATTFGDQERSAERIGDFYAGTSVFVTGGSGYLGKVIVEKLLRTCTSVRYVYVLLRPKRGQTVEQRLQSLLEAHIFHVLRNEMPDRLHKLRVIEGDILADGLGISEASLQRLRSDVGVVLHSAATVRFDEPMRIAIDTNLLGLRRLLDLCDEFTALKSIVVISTAYSNGAATLVDERVYAPKVPVDLDWFVETLRTLPDPIAWQLAQHVEGKFYNTYQVTKLLAEQIIEAKYQHLPICIVRPSIVMPTYREPFAGWADQLVGPLYVMTQSMLGTTTFFNSTTDNILDTVPLDFVSNMVLTAAWYDATQGRGDPLRIFNCISSALNPYNTFQGLYHMEQATRIFPSMRTVMYPRIIFTTKYWVTRIMGLLYHVLPAVVMDMFNVGANEGKPPGFMLKLSRIGTAAMQMSLPFAMTNWTFGVDNVLRLLERSAQTADGKTDFGCDVRTINYVDAAYFNTIGFRRYFLRDPDSTLPEARQRLLWITALKYAYHVIQIVLLYVIGKRILEKYI